MVESKGVQRLEIGDQQLLVLGASARFRWSARLQSFMVDCGNNKNREIVLTYVGHTDQPHQPIWASHHRARRHTYVRRYTCPCPRKARSAHSAGPVGWGGCEGQVRLEVRRLPRWTDPGQPFLIGRPFSRTSRPHGAARGFTSRSYKWQ